MEIRDGEEGPACPIDGSTVKEVKVDDGKLEAVPEF